MKIRQGFVSNSSSSSFIVKFPKRPDSREELKSFLNSSILEQYDDKYDIINCLWRNIKEFPYKTAEQKLVGLMHYLHDDDADENVYVYMDLFTHIIGYDCYNELNYWLEHNKISCDDLDKTPLIEILREKYFLDNESFEFFVSYSDDSPIWSVWEHEIAPEIFGKYLIEHIDNH